MSCLYTTLPLIKTIIPLVHSCTLQLDDLAQVHLFSYVSSHPVQTNPEGSRH